MPDDPQSTTPTTPTAKSILSTPLALFSLSPVTGYHRDGYCRASPSDAGNHSVAGIVSESFLDFTAARGNDLRGALGLKGGCKWCLCAGRWKEALEAFRRGEVGREGVPRIQLNATHDAALRDLRIEDLKEFASDKPS